MQSVSEETFAAILASLSNHKANRTLSKDQVGYALRAAGMFPTEEYLSGLPEGKYSLESIRSLQVPRPHMTFDTALRTFDDEGDGSISLADLLYSLEAVGEPLSAQEVEELIILARDNCCIHSDDRVSISHFIQYIHTHYTVEP